jgi:hypothetical protein
MNFEINFLGKTSTYMEIGKSYKAKEQAIYQEASNIYTYTLVIWMKFRFLNK